MVHCVFSAFDALPKGHLVVKDKIIEDARPTRIARNVQIKLWR